MIKLNQISNNTKYDKRKHKEQKKYIKILLSDTDVAILGSCFFFFLEMETNFIKTHNIMTRCRPDKHH